ncbi:MAG TPA: sigma-70 family RNA polymerase sigma factor [Polyangiaceae bacterium]|nr:sigma-70 family RNA polymerase sigma factor [Polyangiaceae bacterium]
MVESLADAELVDRIGRGAHVRDAEAELCRRFAPRIRLYGLRHLRSEDRAADLVQSVLLSVLDAARSGRIDQAEQLDRFVLGTCRNVARRVREKETRTVPVEGAELEQRVGAFEPSFERVDTGPLLRCLQKLEERARSVVLLSFQAEHDSEQIAQTLQLSVGNVRVLRHRALADLRGCLDNAKGGRP